ncbi:uncharacterized protein LOC110763298 [Prunus avium]|uniref:Uncharacterized protein LOC110763298 n=1 Tax=Prunus avium TaxID=42229 RepID=A0A6P5SY63_PRUAV|nr:uncharacterized protein LOC110763298 [Prunus avium]
MAEQDGKLYRLITALMEQSGQLIALACEYLYIHRLNHNSIETLTGSNYSKWKQDLEISLGFLDYDFVLREKPPQEPAADASAETKTKFAKWEKANKMAMLIMQRAMSSSVKGSIPKSKNAQQYYESIAQRFKESEKAVKSSLLNQLIDMKYDGQGCVRAHIMNLIDLGTKLQELDMKIDEDMMSTIS